MSLPPSVRHLPAWLQNALIEMGISFSVLYSTASAGVPIAVLLLGVCPACMALWRELREDRPHNRTARITVRSGHLRCENPDCPAGPEATGVTRDEKPAGLPRDKWLCRYAPLTWESLQHDPRRVRLPDPNGAENHLRTVIAGAVEAAMAEPRVIQVVNVTPPGAGKTREVLAKMVESGTGSFFGPNHRTTDEHIDRYRNMGGGEVRRYSGILRCLLPDLRAQIEPWAEAGFSVKRIAAATDLHLPSAVSGPPEGAPFAVHAHALAPVQQPDEEAALLLRPPGFIDELPPLVDTRRLPAEYVEWATASHLNERVQTWLRVRRPITLLAVALMNAAAKVYSAMPACERRFPVRFHSFALRRMLINLLIEDGRATTEAEAADFIRDLYKSFLSRWLHTTGAGIPPEPPWRDALDGRHHPMRWPRSDFDL